MRTTSYLDAAYKNIFYPGLRGECGWLHADQASRALHLRLLAHPQGDPGLCRHLRGQLPGGLSVDNDNDVHVDGNENDNDNDNENDGRLGQ